MAKVSTYLNFEGQCEEAFTFYKAVFGGQFTDNGPMRFKEMPPQEGMPPLPEQVQDWILHVELIIHGGHSLMGSDVLEGMGPKLQPGNNVQLNLHVDTRAETDRLFNAFAQGGQVTMPLEEQFWGDYFGACVDKFGISWMFGCPEQAQ